jgi:flagellar biosynthesis protein FliR
VGMLGELAIGVFTGFGVNLLFVGVQVGMQFASQQAGLGLANTFNPMMQAQMSTVAQLYYFVAVLLFLAVGGHRALIRTLLDSFEAIPPLGFQVTNHLVSLLFDMTAVSFALGIRVGGPLMLALMLAFLTLGFVSRTVPQLNILSVGFPMKLMVALLTMAVTITAMEDVVLSALTEFLDMTRAGLGLSAM